MMKMKVVTKQEILDFVMKQDPSKPVRMDEPKTSYECGCVMVHYAQDVLKFKGL